MSKKLVRLYPEEIERMSWTPAPEGGSERLVADDGQGSVTRYWSLVGGQTGEGGSDGRWRELFVLEGEFELDGRAYAAGSYLCLPPEAERGDFLARRDSVCLEMLDHHDRLAKPEVRLTAEEVEATPWAEPPSGQTGFSEKVLARDGESLTRLLRVEIGGDTDEVDDHDHDEEVLIVEGSCLNGEEVHPAGTYTFNPPHAIHGPFRIYEPLLCFEVKNAPREADRVA